MKEIHKDTENIEKSLVQEETVLEHYFVCTKRAVVLSQVKDAVLNGVSLILLTGEQGSGKTTMCRLLGEELDSSCTTIFFAQAVDSFEDVVRSIAMELGVDAETEREGEDIGQAVEQITDFLLSESVDLLIIFDEAENIFLATLERIRFMLDHIIGSGAQIHILLSGRETLLENCDQVSVGDFPNSDTLHFDLVPLSYVETADYLRNCVVWPPDIDVSKVFSDAVVNEIYAHAEGNMSMTNILGQDAVKSPNDDTSFMVLLEGVKEGVDTIGEHPVFIRYADFIKRFSVYLPWIGGAVCGLLLFLYLFSPGADESDVGQGTDQTEKIETVTVAQDENVQAPERNELMTVEPAKNEQSMEEKETAVQVQEEEKAPGEATVIMMPGQESSEQDIGQVHSADEQMPSEADGAVESDKNDEIASAVEDVTAEDMIDQEVVEAHEEQMSQTGVTDAGENVVLLRRLDKNKKKLNVSSEPQQGIAQQQSPAEVGGSQGSNSPHRVNQLYEARLVAGLGWLKREKKGMYTVQLMALTSAAAERNLKKMLGQVDYRQESGNFFILKRATAPESIFLFYGEYPSLERARLAQNSLPKFLRDHKPYVLSINGAVNKLTN